MKKLATLACVLAFVSLVGCACQPPCQAPAPVPYKGEPMPMK